MGNIYVWMDAKVNNGPNEELLGIKIDSDFANMSRRELCGHAENRFGLDDDALWNLPSTAKIRLACQLARNMKKVSN
jgi:hypothetical protein